MGYGTDVADTQFDVLDLTEVTQVSPSSGQALVVLKSPVHSAISIAILNGVALVESLDTVS
jgi:hypothetical protein